MERKYSSDEIRILKMRKRKRAKRNKKIYSLCFLAFAFGLIVGMIVGRVSKAQIFSESNEVNSKGNKAKGVANSQKEGESQWKLVLVNNTHEIAKDYRPELQEIQNGLTIDARAAEELENMLSDGEKEGLSLWICSAYRSIEKQTELYNKKVNIYENQGYNYEAACKEAMTEVAFRETVNIIWV